MAEILTPHLFVSMILVIFVIIISLIFREEQNVQINSNIANEVNNEKNIKDKEKDENAVDKKSEEEISLLIQKGKEEAFQQLKSEIKPASEALEGYITLFLSGKLGELNEEQKYTAELISKKSSQISKIIS